MANQHRRGRRSVPEPQDDSDGLDSDGLDWDDAVDVVCVGDTPVAAAAAVAVAKLGLQVCRVLPARVLDEETAEYLRQVTDDVVPAEQTDSVPVRRIDGPARAGDELSSGAMTFVGASLRSWAAKCIAAVGGVISTEVADPRLTTHYTGFGQNIEALSVGTADLGAQEISFDDWLAEQVRRYDISPSPADALVQLVFAEGRVVGVVLQTDVGTETVRARRGVVLALRNDVAALSWPADIGADRVEVAFVTRAASRFGRLELLAQNPPGPLPR